MSGTPRLRSAFPDTPRTEPGSVKPRQSINSTPTRPARRSVIRPSPLVNAVLPSQRTKQQPVISLDLIDGPTQRLYVAAFYVALVAWKFYNVWNIEDDSEVESTWMFLKWTAIDAVFFLALPAFHIPWLEWSFLTTMIIWMTHATMNLFLMYRITIPIFSLTSALFKLAYDRELSLSDQRVKPADILHNSSIILGKQIINLLPEGSAILNPDRESFCIDSSRTTVELPIRINQTTPESIELLRYDLDTEEVETIVIGSKQARKLQNAADKGHDKSDTKTPRTLRYPVSKKGLYQLQKVMDKSKLEVRRRSFDVAVVPCPQAALSTSQVDRCTGDLSGISLQVIGVPPFRVKYSKRINQQKSSSITQSIQPPETDQDLRPNGASQVVMDPKRPQMGWTQSMSKSVDINESLDQNGTWSYSIEEIEDGLANKVTFDTETGRKPDISKHSQAITVHKRPQISLHGCDGEKYLRVAKDDAIKMPLQIMPRGQIPSSDWPLKFRYTFTSDGEDGIPAVEVFDKDIADDKSVPLISKAGRYDILSIASQFCQGEVNEPSSCLLYNPPRPSLTWQPEEIFDKCAGRPIGMIVNLDFTGTPPFRVRYEVTKAGAGTYPRVQEFKGMRGQIEFRERSAGSYKYQLVEISDDVYSGSTSIRSSQNTVSQDIRPPAEAVFKGNAGTVKTCLGQPLSFDVRLMGEGPWDLDYEVVHGGKRKKFTVHSDNEDHTIQIPEQTDGGKYSVILTGVQDASRCKTALKEERSFEVRPEQPRAGFGDIDGRRSIEALQGQTVKIPLKLKGIAPWKVQIRNLEADSTSEYTLRDANSAIQAQSAGTYQIESVHDSCPGIVDTKADKFSISQVARPQLDIKDSTVDHQAGTNTFRKQPVCRGDEDVLNLGLIGNAPYHLKYQIRAEPLKGQVAISNKDFSVASDSGVVSMDTSKAGQYTYTFTELSDGRYTHDKKHFSPLVVKQQVYAPPTAKFSNPGRTYGYCRDEASPPGEAETEHIPIQFTGEPPFTVDIAITHHGISSRPEIVRVKDVFTTSYSWSLSRASLGLGSHSLQIRAVKDSRGCEALIDQDPSTVRIQVSQPPTIIPLEATADYCVGDHVSFSLSGQAPFDIFYNFQNRDRKAHVTSSEFKRISDQPGEFIITGVSDAAMGGGGRCKAKKDIRKVIHPYPTVRISHGKTITSDIHEGGEVEIVFDFTGTPPFEFTYTRSENAKKGRKSQVLETRHDTSDEFSKVIRASDEGTYEVVAIKDRYCAYSAPGLAKASTGKGQKLLKN